MRNTIMFLLLVFISNIEMTNAQSKESDILGKWDAEKRVVEVYKSGQKFIGNPLDKEGHRIEKIQILNLEYKDNQWVGELYAEKRDKTFDVVCEIVDGELNLEISVGFMTKDLVWTRID